MESSSSIRINSSTESQGSDDSFTIQGDFLVGPNDQSNMDIFSEPQVNNHQEMSLAVGYVPEGIDDSLRGPEINFISQFLKDSEGCAWPALFISGDAGSGKTCTVLELLKRFSVESIYIDCAYQITQSKIIHAIIRAIEKKDLSLIKDSKAATFPKLISLLQDYKKTLHPSRDHTLFLVLDNLHRIKNEIFFGTSIPALLNLHKTTARFGLNVSVIMLARLGWDKIRPLACPVEPIVVHFPAWNAEQITKILVKDCSRQHELVFYQEFITLVWDSFNHITRNINDIRRLVILLFPRYILPRRELIIPSNAPEKLTVQFLPYVRRGVLHSLFLKEISPNDLQDPNLLEKPRSAMANDPLKTIKLSSLGKLILVGSYLASHVPEKEDLRLFSSKNVGRSTKKKKIEKTTTNTEPKFFSLIRLFEILKAMIGKPLEMNTAFHVLVSSLCQSQLLTNSQSDNLNQIKLRCEMSFQQAKMLSEDLAIDLEVYLN